MLWAGPSSAGIQARNECDRLIVNNSYVVVVVVLIVHCSPEQAT